MTPIPKIYLEISKPLPKRLNGFNLLDAVDQVNHKGIDK